MNEPSFLSQEQVMKLHLLSLEQHGGQDGIRDLASFESALSIPKTQWVYSQGDLFEVAASYAFHLAQSQCFLDGNKRTGMAAALVFLRVNGVTISQSTEALHQVMLEIAEKRAGKPELAAILRHLSLTSHGK